MKPTTENSIIPLVRVVAALIRNEHGDVLCLLRPKAMSFAGYWQFPGGKVDPEENGIEALIRETKEEIDCDILVHGIFTQSENIHRSKLYQLTTYHCVLTSGTPIALEHEDVRWVSPCELRTLPFGNIDLPTVNQVLSQSCTCC